jgi:hypothetical protein
LPITKTGFYRHLAKLFVPRNRPALPGNQQRVAVKVKIDAVNRTMVCPAVDDCIRTKPLELRQVHQLGAT